EDGIRVFHVTGVQTCALPIFTAVTNRGDMRFMTYTARMTQLKYILFLGRLVQSCNRKVFLIADNLSVHHGKKVRAWADEHSDDRSEERRVGKECRDGRAAVP